MGAMKPERCRCEICRQPAAKIYREWIAADATAAEVELDEAEIARRWHKYAPAQRAVEQRLPFRASQHAARAKETQALRQLRAWLDCTGDFADNEKCTMVVLSGPPGTGKTVAAVWSALHRLALDEPRFFTAQDLARVPRTGEQREELLAATCIVIDDLGAERADEKFTADFDELVDCIYQACAGQLVITTNCTTRQFEQRYGARVVDRFAEVGTWIPVVGKSLRRGR